MNRHIASLFVLAVTLVSGCTTRPERADVWNLYPYLDTRKVEILQVSRKTLDELPARLLLLRSNTSADELLTILGIVRSHPHLPYHSTHHWEQQPYWATMYVDVPDYHLQVMLQPGATNAVGIRIRKGEDGAWVECVPKEGKTDGSANNTLENSRR